MAPANNLKFNFIKANHFRVVHGDGVWGGATPQGNISMGFFSDRQPFPQQISLEISSDNIVGPEIRSDRIVKDGMVRELEVAVVVSRATAEFLIKWLNDSIASLDQQK